jgi:hypothetical protein
MRWRHGGNRVKSFISTIALAALLTSPAYAGWVVQKNETDPFDASRSTFIAMTESDRTGLAIRCLEGKNSLLLISGASNEAVAGQHSDLKIVGDSSPIREESGATILSADHRWTIIYFGDENTLGYMKGANKISVRYSVGTVVQTVSFTGGKPLAEMITKALKACAVTTTPPGRVTATAVDAPPYVFTASDKTALCHLPSAPFDELMVKMIRETTGFNTSDIPAARKIADAAKCS